MRSLLTLAALASLSTTASAERLPIIDMHLHARQAKYAGENPPPMCAPFAAMPRSDPKNGPAAGMEMNAMSPCDRPIPAAATDEQVMRETIAVMDRHNIIGMVSGEPELMKVWRAAAPQRIIPGIDFRLPGTPGQRHVKARSLAELRALHARGELRVLGEIMAQYEGVAANDPRLEPYWALAEELGVPVAIHLGPGEPAQPYRRGGYRASLGNPLLLEEASSIRSRARHFTKFLQDIVSAGYGDRVMFGSDQMIWPGVIEPAIRTIQEAPFLTEAQKRDILYNNAARFLRLTKGEIARHHAM